MEEIELSSMIGIGELFLEKYEATYHNHVRHRQFQWGSAWNELLQIALYMRGPDVSEVGTTWLESLDGMNALRPFSAQEVAALGGVEAFLPGCMLERIQLGQKQILSIPWTLDTRVLFFRRDVLQQAGIEESGAFSSPEALLDTLARLHSTTGKPPFSMTLVTEVVLHNLAAWVWGAGGSFRSPDCKRITLVEPNAMRGMLNFFRLHQFIPPQGRGADTPRADQLFLQGETAVLLSGQWVANQLLRDPNVNRVVRENYGVALAPGIPYVGGSSLIVWRHTLHDRAAIGLLQHLTSAEVGNRIFEADGNLPARLSVLENPPYTSDPMLQTLVQSVKSGRRLRSDYRWAGVEMRLNVLLSQLWVDVFEKPDLDLEKEISTRVREMAARLERTLLADW